MKLVFVESAQNDESLWAEQSNQTWLCSKPQETTGQSMDLAGSSEDSVFITGCLAVTLSTCLLKVFVFL